MHFTHKPKGWPERKYIKYLNDIIEKLNRDIHEYREFNKSLNDRIKGLEILLNERNKSLSIVEKLIRIIEQ